MTDLHTTARALVDSGKGILAADETVFTVTKRLAAVAVQSTPDSRREYREMFFTTPGIAEYISGVILHEETIHQCNSTGARLVDVLAQQNIIPGIKVDAGTQPFAGSTKESITEGLDGLRARLTRFREIGARFAKWRAVIVVSGPLPSAACVQANAHALARYAALCQEQGLVPIVEPEVLMDGPHTIARCEEVTGNVLHAVFEALWTQTVALDDILLKPNMVISGQQCAAQASVANVAAATVRCLQRFVPASVPGIVFLSGGQDHLLATLHLNAINRFDAPKPWPLTFSYGRALQAEALNAWRGRPENLMAGQQAFYHRARCASAAALGMYKPSMETVSLVV